MSLEGWGEVKRRKRSIRIGKTFQPHRFFSRSSDPEGLHRHARKGGSDQPPSGPVLPYRNMMVVTMVSFPSVERFLVEVPPLQDPAQKAVLG